MRRHGVQLKSESLRASSLLCVLCVLCGQNLIFALALQA